MEKSFSAGTHPLIIPGPAGEIEAELFSPKQEEDGDFMAVVCHPHSLHGGTMKNKVVHTATKAFYECGMPTLRFNFRGVGKSQGDYDAGEGEGDDLAACIEWMEAQFPGKRLVLAGFSFGSFVSLKHAPRFSLAAMVSIAPPVARFDVEACETPQVPWVVVIGSDDELVALSDVESWLAKRQASASLTVLQDASHFFHGRLLDLRKVLLDFLQAQFGISRDE